MPKYFPDIYSKNMKISVLHELIRDLEDGTIKPSELNAGDMELLRQVLNSFDGENRNPYKLKPFSSRETKCERYA